MHGCAPSWRRMSIASTQARAPLASAPASESLGPLRVSTVRLWTGSEWVSSSAAPVAKAVEIASIRRRVAALGEVRHREQHAGFRSDEEVAVADHRLAVDGERRAS